MSELLYFNSHDSLSKVPFGAVPCGQEVALTLLVKDTGAQAEVQLVIWGSELSSRSYSLELMRVQEGGLEYRTTFTAPLKPGLLWYYFQVQLGQKTLYYGNNQRRQGGSGQIQETAPLPYQITVYWPSERDLPGSWLLDGLVYHIFVDRFYNGCEDGRVLNPKAGSLLHGRWEDTPLYIRDSKGRIKRWDFFGGNLPGIIKKLPYLKELGVTALYLSPVFEAPSNHKYDTADYHRIDPMFGSEEDFRLLCRLAGEQGLAVILDGVFSHTGSDSIYFNREGSYPGLGACQSKQSPYYSWYRFENYPQKYECWWGIDSLPNVNELEPSYLDFIIRSEDSVIKHWMRAGVRGWRLDVADELPDEFIRELHSAVKENDPEGVVIGEVWEDASNKISYGQQRQFFWGQHLDGVTNYPFRRILLDFILGKSSSAETHGALCSLAENYPPPNLAASLNILGSHDVPRILSLLGQEGETAGLSEEERESFQLEPAHRALAKARLKLLVIFQMTFPGVPCIYYGDEAGLEGLADPYNRKPYPWGREDEELLSWYKKVIRLRQEKPVLRRGLWQSLGLVLEQDNPGSGVYGYTRVLARELAVVLVNPAIDRAVTVKVRLGRLSANELVEAWTDQELSGQDGVYNFRLEPLQGRIFLGLIREDKL